MDTRIFTEEQKDFYLDVYDDSQKLGNIITEFKNAYQKGEISATNASSQQVIFSVLSYLQDSQSKIKKELDPFNKRNAEYQERRNEILKKHGFDSDSELDSETVREIGDLQNTMREETKDLPCNFKK